MTTPKGKKTKKAKKKKNVVEENFSVTDEQQNLSDEQLIISDSSFLDEMKKLAERTRTQKKIDNLFHLEELLHQENIKRTKNKVPRFSTLMGSLLKNQTLIEKDFFYLYDMLNNVHEEASVALIYRDHVKSLIIKLCAEAINRGYSKIKTQIWIDYPNVKTAKSVKDALENKL